MTNGVIATLTADSTNVTVAVKANRVLACRVNCKAIGAPGIAANSKMPIVASGANGNM